MTKKLRVKNKLRVWDDLESKNTIIKLLNENFNSIGKSNTTVPLLQTPNFLQDNNFTLPKKHAHGVTNNKSKSTNR